MPRVILLQHDVEIPREEGRESIFDRDVRHGHVEFGMLLLEGEQRRRYGRVPRRLECGHPDGAAHRLPGQGDVRSMVDSGRYGKLRATVGHVRTSPGLPSVVPDLAEITVDLRNPDDALMARAEEELARFLAELPETQPGLRVETKRMAKTASVPFAEEIRDTISNAAKELGHNTIRLMSGAGHDAQEMAAIAPTAMIFIRGQFDGISHNPREYSTPEDCAAGISVLARTIQELAG